MSFEQLFDLWEGDARFCEWYSELLAGAQEAAFFWEHPPLSGRAPADDAEFVLIDAPALAGERADSRPFATQFGAAGDSAVAVFSNLGGDALLVAPCPRAASSGYPHLAAFVRHAPTEQVRALWRETARAWRRVAGPDPVWLSTSGLGVAWLHLRLDRFPKYYQHLPYKSRR